MTTNEELKKLAEAATPGPWRTGSISRWCSLPHQHGGNACKYTNVSWNDDPAFFGRYVSVASDGAEIVGGDNYGPKLSLSDAAYIAAANPTRIQALLTELSELKARAEAAEAQVKAHLEELERLRATVAKIASQSIGDEIGDEEARSNADYELAYEECVRAARSIRTAKEPQA